jgi:hypothetical protein
MLGVDPPIPPCFEVVVVSGRIHGGFGKDLFLFYRLDIPIADAHSRQNFFRKTADSAIVTVYIRHMGRNTATRLAQRNADMTISNEQIQATYELSQLRQGWKENDTQQEDAAIETIQSFTGWDAELAEYAFAQAQWELAEAEQRIREDAAQKYFDKCGHYPTKPFYPRCEVEIGGYIVSRGRVKTRHCSESSRVQYIWKKA